MKLKTYAENITKYWSAIDDSMTHNEESKIAYDYVMMLRNNKFKYDVDEIHKTKQKIWEKKYVI